MLNDPFTIPLATALPWASMACAVSCVAFAAPRAAFLSTFSALLAVVFSSCGYRSTLGPRPAAVDCCGRPPRGRGRRCRHRHGGAPAVERKRIAG